MWLGDTVDFPDPPFKYRRPLSTYTPSDTTRDGRQRGRILTGRPWMNHMMEGEGPDTGMLSGRHLSLMMSPSSYNSWVPVMTGGDGVSSGEQQGKNFN